MERHLKTIDEAIVVINNVAWRTDYKSEAQELEALVARLYSLQLELELNHDKGSID